MSFDYNSSGLRTKKVVGDKTIEYYYSGDLLVAQFDGTYWVRFIYSASGEAIGFTCSMDVGNGEIVDGDYCYYVKNVQGDILGFYSMFYSIFREYTYDSWGNITGVYDQYGRPVTDLDDPAYLNPLRYRSYYYDDETGLYYLNSRYYNPEWGTFISADGYLSTGEQIVAKNMYAYCLNNPVNYSDPSGCYAQLCVGCSLLSTFNQINYCAAHKPKDSILYVKYPYSQSSSTTSSNAATSSKSDAAKKIDYSKIIGDRMNDLSKDYIANTIDDFAKVALNITTYSSLTNVNQIIVGFKNAANSTFGIGSAFIMLWDIAADIEQNSGSLKNQAISVSITVLETVATVGVVAAATSVGLAPTAVVALSVLGGAIISDYGNLFKSSFIK